MTDHDESVEERSTPPPSRRGADPDTPAAASEEVALFLAILGISIGGVSALGVRWYWSFAAVAGLTVVGLVITARSARAISRLTRRATALPRELGSRRSLRAWRVAAHDFIHAMRPPSRRACRRASGGTLLAGVVVATLLIIDPFAAPPLPHATPVGWYPLRPPVYCGRVDASKPVGSSCGGVFYVSFNRYVNAPNYGDERAFADVKIIRPGPQHDGGWADIATVKPGDRIRIRVYYNNAAWVGVPRSIAVPDLVAHNTRVLITFDPRARQVIDGIASISADCDDCQAVRVA